MLAPSAAIQAARSRFLGPIRLMESLLLTRIRASPVPKEGVAKETLRRAFGSHNSISQRGRPVALSHAE
jgi:hypothetical protein